MIKINKTLADATDPSKRVSMGTILEFETFFPAIGDKFEVGLYPYKSLAAKEAGAGIYTPTEIKAVYPGPITIDLTTLTQEQLAIFVAAKNLIHDLVREKIEAIEAIGEGKTEQI